MFFSSFHVHFVTYVCGVSVVRRGEPCAKLPSATASGYLQFLHFGLPDPATIGDRTVWVAAPPAEDEIGIRLD